MNFLTYMIIGVQSSEELGSVKFDLNAISANDGWTITVVGIIIVFLSLILLSLAVLGISIFVNARKKKRAEAKGQVIESNKDVQMSDEVSTAIAMALHLYLNTFHEEESGILTINRIERPYKPWSSKLYNLTQYPEKK